jgi:hypothetical protein
MRLSFWHMQICVTTIPAEEQRGSQIGLRLGDLDFDVLVRLTATGAQFESVTYFPTQFLDCLLARWSGRFDSANRRALMSQRPPAVACA